MKDGVDRTEPEKNETAAYFVKPNRKPVFCKTEPKTEPKSFFANHTPLIITPALANPQK